MSPFENRIYDPQEEALIHQMMAHVPLLVSSIERGAVAQLRERLARRAEAHHSNKSEFEQNLFKAVNDHHPEESSADQNKRLSPACEGDAAYIRDLRIYGNVLNGLQQVLFSRIFDTLVRLEPGDSTPDDAAKNLADALYHVQGLGKHEADQMVRNLEMQVDRALAHCLGERGR